MAKVEQQVADKARREKLANCNCFPHDPKRLGAPFVVSDEKKFESEMNLTCPAHGFRRFGQLLVLKFVHSDGTFDEKSVRLGQVVDEYERRLSEFLKSHPELEDDFKEP